MARPKPSSPYFNFVHSPPPCPTPTPTSGPLSLTRTRKQDIGSSDMVNFSKLDNKTLIEAAMAPGASQPEQQPKHTSSRPPKELDAFGATSRKRTRISNKARLSSDSIFEPNSSEETFTKKPTKKKQRQLANEDEPYGFAQRPLQTEGNGPVYRPENVDDYDGEVEGEDNTALEPIIPAKSKRTPPSQNPSSSSCRAAMAPKRRKSLGTPVPSSLENAHPADRELFKMKADGKPWKEIKVVWERLMEKQIGDSTLSVRYCKMKDNFEKSDGKNDIRILNFKARVEAELETDKWERVARMTEEDGGMVMTAKEVRLRFKEIEMNDSQVSRNNTDKSLPDISLPDITEADMDPIDRELAGVPEVDGVSESTGVEHGYVDESISLKRDIRMEEVSIEGRTQAEQKLVESFGKVNGMEDVEFDIEGSLAKLVAVGEGLLVDERSLKLSQEGL